MRIKTYYAKSMKAALQLIKEQLGPDALIVSSREFPPPESGRPAEGFEVVAAIDEDPRSLCASGRPGRGGGADRTGSEAGMAAAEAHGTLAGLRRAS